MTLTPPDETSTGGPARGAVLVTGAGSGIGRAASAALAAAGFSVFAGIYRPTHVAWSRDRVSPIELDVTDPSSVAAAASSVALALGRNPGLAGIVNCAGILVSGPLEYVSPEAMRRQLDVNVVGALSVAQAFLPLLRRARGRIVQIGSTSGRIAGSPIGAYCASKFALEALTSVLRAELADDIAVTIIEPGVVATPLWDKVAQAERVLAQELDLRGRAEAAAALRARRTRLAALGRDGLPATRVADAIVCALTARRPKRRYIVGSDARVKALIAQLVPEALVEGARVIRRSAGRHHA